MREIPADNSKPARERQAPKTPTKKPMKPSDVTFYRQLAAMVAAQLGGVTVHKGTGHGGNSRHGYRRGTYGNIRRIMKRTARMF